MSVPIGVLMSVPIGVPMSVPIGVPMSVPIGVPMSVPIGVPIPQKKSYTKLQKIIQIRKDNMQKKQNVAKNADS